MPDRETITEYRLKMAEDRIGSLAQNILEMQVKFDKRERERTIEERKKLWAGISFLGGIVMSLMGIVWSFRGVIFRGGQP